MEDFIQRFVEIFDEMDIASVNSNTKFRELEEWDSIAALSVIGLIDEEYNVTFKADDMRACQTVGDLFHRIQSKK